MKFVFDLDGVLRHLSPLLGREPSHWDEPATNGQSVLEFFEERPWLLMEAPTLPYLDVVNRNLKEIKIITCQPPRWVEPTLNWIRDHLKGPEVTTIIVSEPMEKFGWLGPEDILVEDYPRFPAEQYRRIAMVDWPYNRGIDAFMRITSPEQLEWALRKWRG